MIGRARIDALAESVSRACISLARSEWVDAHRAADLAASAALSTAWWTVSLARSTCATAFSASRSVVLCAVCAAPSSLAPREFAALPPAGRSPLIVVLRSMVGAFQKKFLRSAPGVKTLDAKWLRGSTPRHRTASAPGTGHAILGDPAALNVVRRQGMKEISARRASEAPHEQ